MFFIYSIIWLIIKSKFDWMINFWNLKWVFVNHFISNVNNQLKIRFGQIFLTSYPQFISSFLFSRAGKASTIVGVTKNKNNLNHFILLTTKKHHIHCPLLIANWQKLLNFEIYKHPYQMQQEHLCMSSLFGIVQTMNRKQWFWLRSHLSHYITY